MKNRVWNDIIDETAAAAGEGTAVWDLKERAMISLKIEDIRQFTSDLFIGTVFDEFLVREAVFVTFNTFTIDGRMKQGYYTERELEENRIEELSSWAMLKPFCFSLIKGKKLPGSFQITLQAPPKEVEKFLAESQLPLRPEQINGLYFHIRYEEGRLSCVTGTSLHIFTLDRMPDMEWDEAVKIFLKEHKIPYTAE